MALPEFHRNILNVVSSIRIERGEAYLAGATALRLVTDLTRVSRDIDIFHDSAEAVRESFQMDRRALASAGYTIEIQNRYEGFIRAVVKKNGDSLLMDWARDSAFRFFPLIRLDEPSGGSPWLSLHPFDLAVNKTLALVGRLESKDWIDLLSCARKIQPLGYLVWAGTGKDPGLSPGFILDQAGRTARYTQEEFNILDFDSPPPDLAALHREWKGMLEQASRIIRKLPETEVGKCVLLHDGSLYKGSGPELESALGRGLIRFHRGRLGGAFPKLSPLQ